MGTTISASDVLRDGFSGQVLAPEQPGYDEARQVFNAMIDRHPALIARCATPADAVAAVNAAREHGLMVAVRCGGHSFSGLSTCDDGIVIDLSGLKSITVDPQARVARAGGGVLWGEFDAATQAHGLNTRAAGSPPPAWAASPSAAATARGKRRPSASDTWATSRRRL